MTIKVRTIAIALIALVPVLVGANWWKRSHAFAAELDGKAKVFEARAPREEAELFLCLGQHIPDGPMLFRVSTEGTFAPPDELIDPARGLIVRIEMKGKEAALVRAWLPQGQALTPVEAAQLDACTGVQAKPI
ncbi:hypothetical protein [Novosphingobium sp.]|uniref:hypothetical protein n=1 Tax=Novosphingobium sp. TaxID=1874826 RepID=UPI0035B2DA1D